MIAFLVAAITAPVVPAEAAPPPPPMETRVEVPADHGSQDVQVARRAFAVGGSSGWHTHPGIEIGHVVSGVTEMRTADGAPRRYKTGETFVIERGTVHNGVNVGEEPALLVITYVVDRGAPVRIAAPEPAGR